MKKADTKLQILLILLSVMAVLSSFIGGYLYYSSLTRYSLEQVHKDAAEQLKDIGNDIDSYLNWSLFSVKSLAGLKELNQSLLNRDANTLETNAVLKQFRSDLKVSVCYLMDRSGKTIASSNVDLAKSFVGKNYGFRPYFIQAMEGKPGLYMGVGITSKQRGIYYSHPVYARGEETPLGVAVIKAPIQRIEKNFQDSVGIVLLTGPNGVVFASSRSDWLYHLLWKTSSKTIDELAATKQFGGGPWIWTGMERLDQNNAMDDKGNKYRIHQRELANYPGWHLISLHGQKGVVQKIYTPLRRSVGAGILILCLGFGLIVFFLFTKAKASIIQGKKVEEKLRESEKRFKILHNASFGGITIHEKGIILDCNQGLCDLTGYSTEELIGMDGLQLIAPKWRNLVMEKILDGFELYYEVKGLRKDNIQFDVRIQAKNIPYHGRIVRVTEFRDITERKLAEKEKTNAQKIAWEQDQLALVGQVAGKIAHDFNNILGVIMGNAELSLQCCNDQEAKETLELIFEQTLRGKNLTRNLVAFAKSQEPKQEFFYLRDKIEFIINLLRKDLAGIELVIENEQGLPELLADSGMIEHALVNLFQNSIHALGRVEAPKIIIRTYCRKNFICFEIEDNGCGIPPEHLDSIYNPSFTLKGSRDVKGMYKEEIKGTGYGMSNVKKYVQQHKGEIFVESESMAGTCVTIKLPVIKTELTKVEIGQICKSKIQTKKSILIVEDEKAISDVQSQILTHGPCFHRVDIANSGQAAIDLLEKNEYDLISLDYMLLDHMNGMDVYTHVRKTNQKIPVLFISGNIEFLESIKNLKQKDAKIDHLSKPCMNKEYVNSINRLLVSLEDK